VFRLASFNANSIRSRMPIILDWIAANDCDVLCVQETKVTDADFPVDAIRDAGLHCVFNGQKSYNGVAIISKTPPDDVVKGLGTPAEEARVIRARFGDVIVLNTYVPQGTSPDSPRFQYKLDFIAGIPGLLSEEFGAGDKIVWTGDFNVAPKPIDVYDPEGLLGSVCYHPLEQKAFEAAMSWPFQDVFRKHHPDEPYQYTFWDYRVPNAVKRKMGWRLDHIVASKPLADLSVNSWIDIAPRMLEKPSDHTFIAADFDI